MQSPLLAEAKLASVLIPRMCSSILLAPSSCRHVRPRPARSSATPCMAACVQCRTSPAGHALPAFSVVAPGAKQARRAGARRRRWRRARRRRGAEGGGPCGHPPPQPHPTLTLALPARPGANQVVGGVPTGAAGGARGGAAAAVPYLRALRHQEADRVRHEHDKGAAARPPTRGPGQCGRPSQKLSRRRCRASACEPRRGVCCCSFT